MSARLHLAAAPQDGPGRPPGLLGAPVVYGPESDLPLQAPGAEDLSAHLDWCGNRPVTAGLAGDELLSVLERLELTGRGGGHFPVARKWRTQLSAGAGGMVVANGAESEPLSAKDASLLQLRPHLVLDGLACTAQAVGAAEVVVWLHEGARASRVSVARAVTERQAAGFVEPAVRVELAPEHYLSGESGAVVNALSGGPALPQFRRTPASVKGVHGRPTLIHNVETLARIALAARQIPAATTLLTVATNGRRTVLEVDPGTRLAQAVRLAGHEPPMSAALIGGYGGRWLGAQDLSAAQAHESSLRHRGASLGAGIILPLDEGECGLRRSADIARYLADSGARQCGPCLFGLPAVADSMAALVGGAAGRRDLSRLHRFLAEIQGRGACHHPDGAVAMVSSSLAVFADDVQSHLRRGSCAA